MDQSRCGSGFLIAILLAHFAVCAAYGLVVPLAEAPDELSHYDFFRFVAQERTLPVGTEVDEAIQPPLYYMMAAALTTRIPMGLDFARSNPDFRLSDPDAPKNLFIHGRSEAFPYRGGPLAMHVVRLLSALLSTVAVWAVYRVALLLSRGNCTAALGAAAFLAFVPGFCFLGGAVHNDNLVAAVSALLVWRLLVILKGDDSPAQWGLAGALLGLALLSKVSLLGFVPLFVGVAGYRVWQRRESGRLARAVWTQAVGLGLAFGLALMISGWWFLRNVRLHGDPLGWNLVLAGVDLRTCPFGLGDLWWLFGGLFESFWGRFGGAAHIRMPSWLYVLLGGFTVAAIAGALVALWRWRSESGGRGVRLAQWGLLAIWAGLILALLVRYTGTALGTNQARLLYPALVSLVAILWFGALNLIPGRHRQTVIWAFPAFLLACNVGILLFLLRPVYSPPPPPAPAELEAASDAPMEDFGGQIRLLGYRLEPEVAVPGQPAGLVLYWQALEDLREDYRVSLWVEGPPSLPPWEIKRAPAAGRSPTDLWEGGEVTADRYRLDLPPDAPVGDYRLDVGLRSFADGRWLEPMSPATKEGAGHRIGLSSFSHQPAVFSELPDRVPHRLRVELGEEVALVGYEVQEVPHPTRPEVEGLRLVLYWETLGPARRDLTFFVHLLDSDGQFVAGHDAVPYGGSFPTSAWPSQAIVADVHYVPLESVCPGQSLVPEVGAYPAPIGPRLTVVQGDRPAGEDRILLDPYRLSQPAF